MINALSWYNSGKQSKDDPCKNLCLLGTVAGRIKLVDVDKNRVVWKEDFGDKNTVYDTDWSRDGILAVGGNAKEVILRKF